MTLDERASHMSPETYERIRVVKPVDYVPKYQGYLGTTDEKEVFARALAPLLQSGTVLDIGAGTGDIPDKLGLDPAKYTAIEQKPEFIDLLSNKGYNVVPKLFPYPLPERYDNVLISYALYGDTTRYGEIIDAAWELVDDDGTLVVVTSRDAPDDYSNFLNRVGRSWRGASDECFNYLNRKFTSLGNLTLSSVRSHIYGDTVDDLADSLSFVATNNAYGTPEERAVLRDQMITQQPYLDERYRTEQSGYQFPMDHYIFVTRRI